MSEITNNMEERKDSEQKVTVANVTDSMVIKGKGNDFKLKVDTNNDSVLVRSSIRA